MEALALVAGYFVFVWAFLLCGIRVQFRWWRLRDARRTVALGAQTSDQLTDSTSWVKTTVEVLALGVSCVLPWLAHHAHYVSEHNPGAYLLTALLWAGLVQAWVLFERRRG